MRRPVWLLLAVALLAWWIWRQPSTRSDVGTAQRPVLSTPAPPVADPARDIPVVTPTSVAYPTFLPVEAHAVLDRIVQGQPHPYPQDGDIFGNRERRLPAQPRGYYREYTVPTAGERDRGARRIVTGGAASAGERPREFWYTADHYRSFRVFQLN